MVCLCSDVGGLDDHSLGDDYVVRALQPPLLPHAAGAPLCSCVSSVCVHENVPPRAYKKPSAHVRTRSCTHVYLPPINPLIHMHVKTFVILAITKNTISFKTNT